MIDSQRLIQMSQQEIEQIRREKLVDISSVKINGTLPPEQKALAFLEQVKNPYCFLCGKTPVRICFTDDAPSLGQLLEHYFIRLKQG